MSSSGDELPVRVSLIILRFHFVLGTGHRRLAGLRANECLFRSGVIGILGVEPFFEPKKGIPDQSSSSGDEVPVRVSLIILRVHFVLGPRHRARTSAFEGMFRLGEIFSSLLMLGAQKILRICCCSSCRGKGPPCTNHPMVYKSFRNDEDDLGAKEHCHPDLFFAKRKCRALFTVRRASRPGQPYC